MNEKASLARRMFCIQCDEEGLGCYPSKPNGPYRLSLWKCICEGEERFYPNFSFERGVGSTIFHLP